MKPIRIAFAAILVASAGIAGLYGSGVLLDTFMAEETASGGGQRQNAPARVVVVSAVVAPIQRTAEAVGSTEAVQSIDVQPTAAGRVVGLSFEEASDVAKGQLLVQLDDREAQASLKEAEASLEEARGNLERARQLAAQNIQSDATLEANEALVLRAEAVREQALNAVEDRRIVSPFAGRIGLSGVDVGQMVTPTTVVTSLDDLSDIDLTFSLPEAYFAQVESGQPVLATSDAYGDRRFEGRVTAIDSRIDAASRAFTVRATIPNADRALATGMFMGVSIVLEERRSVSVPEVAVVNEGDAAYLFTVEADAAKRRDVEVGLRQDGRVEILSGIDEGAMVVVSGLQSVRDGRQVEITGGDEAPATAPAEDDEGPTARASPAPATPAGLGAPAAAAADASGTPAAASTGAAAARRPLG